MDTDTIVGKKLENIESELYDLKSLLINFVQQKKGRKIVKLKGALKGITINEGDIQKSKKSLFRTNI